MKASKNVVAVDFAGQVDRLGYLSSEQAELKEEADGIKTTLRASGLDVIEGRLFRATIGKDSKATTVDWEAIAREFIPATTLDRLIAKHSTHGTKTGAVRVVARKGGKK